MLPHRFGTKISLQYWSDDYPNGYGESLDGSYMGTECICKNIVLEYFIFFRIKRVKEQIELLSKKKIIKNQRLRNKNGALNPKANIQQINILSRDRLRKRTPMKTKSC